MKINKARLFSLFPLGLAVLISLRSLANEPGSIQGVRFEQRIGAPIPTQLSFTDENGQHVLLSELMDRKPRILVFAYYRCPNLCTLVLNGLVQALRELPEKLGKDYEVLTLSIDPMEKTALALMKKRSYLARYGDTGSRAWHFLTGPEESIRALAGATGFHYQKDRVSGEYSHPSGIIVLSPDGMISQYFFGIQFDSKKLHEALKTAKIGKPGSWIEEILLYCFHYDPKASTTSASVLLSVRIAGILVALAIIGVLVFI